MPKEEIQEQKKMPPPADVPTTIVKDGNKIVFTFDRERVVRAAYPILAGVPTAMLILYFFDFGQVYRDVLNNMLSPILTGVVSGAVLYMLGLRR